MLAHGSPTCHLELVQTTLSQNRILLIPNRLEHFAYRLPSMIEKIACRLSSDHRPRECFRRRKAVAAPAAPMPNPQITTVAGSGTEPTPPELNAINVA
jgi:hypothetical protein